MKFKTLLLYLAILVFSISCSTSGSLSREQKKELKNEQIEKGLKEVKALLESGTYIFTVQTAQPTGGTAIRISDTNYSIDSKDKYLKAVLPYFGRGYASHYSNDPGIKFEGNPESFEIREDHKKNNIQVNFKISGELEGFSVSMYISSTGFGTATITSQNRQSISYYGYLMSMPQDYRF